MSADQPTLSPSDLGYLQRMIDRGRRREELRARVDAVRAQMAERPSGSPASIAAQQRATAWALQSRAETQRQADRLIADVQRRKAAETLADRHAAEGRLTAADKAVMRERELRLAAAARRRQSTARGKK